jgi:uncharacterized protein YjbJ (UPF0337 family)
MNPMQMKGSRRVAKGKLKQELGPFTDDDLDYAADEKEELVGCIQRRRGKPRQELERILDEQGCH